MAVDYDLIILGGTSVAREVAMAAARYKARVALVEPHPPERWATGLAFHILRAMSLGKHPSEFKPCLLHPPDLALAIAQQSAAALQEQPSIAHLTSLGVDVIEGQAEFSPRPRLGLRVDSRLLRSRSYLLLLPQRTRMPSIPGLDNADPQVPETLWTLEFWKQPPHRVTVVGSGAIACELAQLLARMGHSVTLIAETALLPEQEPELVRLIQAILQAEGVTVIAPTPMARIWVEQGHPWVETIVGAIGADVLLVTGPMIPDVGSLNLAAIDVPVERGQIRTNAYLQTAHPSIYACDALASGGRATALIALKNALFVPIFKVPPMGLPDVVLTDPPLVSFGLTTAQAERRGGRYKVLRQTFQSLPKAHSYQQTTGLCRLLVRHNGQLLGGHIVGAEAEEWAGILMLAQRRRIPLQSLAELPLPSPSLANGVQAIAQEWQSLQREQHPWLLRRLDHWFDAQRSWMP